MDEFKVSARAFYGLSIAGIGFLHFIFPGFQPLILPLAPESTQSISTLIYVLACYLIITGILICFGKFSRQASIVLGFVLLLFLLLGHLPMRLKNHPEIQVYWIDAVKLLALSGGAFVISSIHSSSHCAHYIDKSAKIATLGKLMFAAMLINFGTVHLLNGTLVAALVPKWIHFSVFWTYFTGIALVASGTSFALGYKVKFAGLLLAIMLLLWLVMLHIPAAIQWKDAVNIISSLECLAFAAIAATIALDKTRNKNQHHALA